MNFVVARAPAPLPGCVRGDILTGNEHEVEGVLAKGSRTAVPRLRHRLGDDQTPNGPNVFGAGTSISVGRLGLSGGTAVSSTTEGPYPEAHGLPGRFSEDLEPCQGGLADLLSSRCVSHLLGRSDVYNRNPADPEPDRLRPRARGHRERSARRNGAGLGSPRRRLGRGLRVQCSCHRPRWSCWRW